MRDQDKAASLTLDLGRLMTAKLKMRPCAFHNAPCAMLMLALGAFAMVMFVSRAAHAHQTQLMSLPRRCDLDPGRGQERLLVIVIASGNKPVYAALRGFWRMIQAKTGEYGVHIYLVGRQPHLQQPVLSDGTLLFPGTETLIPGVLEETLDAVDYVFRHKIPGHKSKHVLRTNLSSFWHFPGLLAWLVGKPEQKLVAALIGYSHEKHEPFPAGAGFIFSKDVWLWVLGSRDKLDFGLIDDLALGALLRAHSMTITPMPRDDTYIQQIQQPPATFSCGHFHWRVLTASSLQDIAVFSTLYFHWYGPASTLATRER